MSAPLLCLMALDALRRQGWQGLAELAEERWEAFREWAPPGHISMQLDVMIEQANEAVRRVNAEHAARQR